MSKKRKSDDLQLIQEREEWEDYLLADLRERIQENRGQPLSQRQLKKTKNGDATYERLLRVIGLGDRNRLERVMQNMVQELKELELVCHESEASLEPTLSVSPPASDQECHESETSLKEEKDPEKALQATRIRKKWDKPMLVGFLSESYQKLGRIPKQEEIRVWSKEGLCPSYGTWMRILECPKADWEEVVLKDLV